MGKSSTPLVSEVGMWGFPIVAQWKRTQLASMRMWVGSLASLSGLRIQHCCELWCRAQTRLGSSVAVHCGVGGRRGLDLLLLWLWCRPAAAALIRPLAWELPYAMGAPAPHKKRVKQNKDKQNLRARPQEILIKRQSKNCIVSRRKVVL